MFRDSYKTLIGFSFFVTVSYISAHPYLSAMTHVITRGHVLTVVISEAEHISEVIVCRAAET